MIKKVTIKRAFMFLLVLSVSLLAIEWQEIDHGFEAVVIKDLITVGEYQIALVKGVPQLYRRKVGSESWECVYGPYQAYSLLSEDRHHELIYFKEMLIWNRGSRTSRISRDSGATWDTLTDAESDIRLEITFNKELIGDTILDLTYGQSVLASVDCGETYTNIFNRGDEDISAVEKHNETIYLGGWGQIYRSANFGETWDTLVAGLPGRTAIRDILVQDSVTLYASTDEGVYRSIDNGGKWQGVDLQFTAADFSVLQELTIFDSAVYGMSQNRVYRLLPSGDRFTEVTFPVHDKYDRSQISLFNNKLCIAGFDGVYELEAGAAQFSLVHSGLERMSRIYSLTATDTYLYAETYDIAGYRFILRADVGGATWDTIFIAKSSSLSFGQNGKYLCASYDVEGESVFYYSEDYGNTWEARENMNNPLYNGYLLDEVNDTLYCGEYFDIQYSVDHGETWDTMTFSDTSYMYLTKSGTRMFFSKYFPGVKGSKGYRVLYYSDDNGETFNECNDSLRSLTNIKKAPDGTVLASSGSKYAFSKDQGESWSFHEQSTVSVMTHFCDSTLIGYEKRSLGKYLSVPWVNYYSTDKGNSWAAFPSTDGASELNSYLTDAVLLRNKSTVYCSEGGRIYKIDASKLTGSNPVVNAQNIGDGAKQLCTSLVTPQAIALTLHLQKRDHYTASLFNASGRIIRSVTGVMQGESQELVIDRRGLSQGYYILQVQANNRKEVLPLVLR